MDHNDPWRYRCPDGHTSWTPVRVDPHDGDPSTEYYCRTCKEHYDHLLDMMELSNA